MLLDTIMPELSKDEIKEAFKLGLKEWLDDKFADFGKWSLGGLFVCAMGGVIWLFFLSMGWHK